MAFHRKLSVQSLVWLAALMLPAQAFPAACTCGQVSKAALAPVSNKATMPSCPHCRARGAHACCRGGSCCCCCGKAGSVCHGRGCHCVRSTSRPVPDSTPAPSPTSTTKSPTSAAAFGGPATADVATAQTAFTAAHQHAILFAAGVPDRLAVLCRLVI